jgi:hypothetical protein
MFTHSLYYGSTYRSIYRCAYNLSCFVFLNPVVFDIQVAKLKNELAVVPQGERSPGILFALCGNACPVDPALNTPCAALRAARAGRLMSHFKYLSIHFSIYLFSFYLSIYLSIYLTHTNYLPVCLPICLSFSLYICIMRTANHVQSSIHVVYLNVQSLKIVYCVLSSSLRGKQPR